MLWGTGNDASTRIYAFAIRWSGWQSFILFLVLIDTVISRNPCHIYHYPFFCFCYYLFIFIILLHGSYLGTRTITKKRKEAAKQKCLVFIFGFFVAFCFV